MTPTPTALAMFVVLIVLLFSGMPVALALGGTGLIFSLVAVSVFGTPLQEIYGVFVKNIFDRCIDNDLLIAIPLFIAMGMVLDRSGMARDLLTLIERLLGRTRGGLALAVVMVGGLLAASTGIVGATVVTLTVMAMPVMLKAGYAPAVAAGTIAASGTLGQIIPPSIVLILLADQMDGDAGALFRGAMLPGLLLIAGYALWLLILARLRPRQLPPSPPPAGPLTVAMVLAGLVPPLALIVLVLGSILAGWATPTEAAGIGAVGAALIAVAKRRFGGSDLRDAVDRTLRVTAMVMLILLASLLFGIVFRALEGERAIADFLAGWRLGQADLIYLIMALVFVLGFFLDFLEICFVVVPLMMPLLGHLQMVEAEDKVFIGVLLALNLQTSFLTPPFGFSLFYLKGAAPAGLRTGQIYLGVLPFVAIQLAVLALVWFNPWLVL